MEDHQVYQHYTLWKFQKEKSKKNGQKKVLNIQKK